MSKLASSWIKGLCITLVVVAALLGGKPAAAADGYVDKAPSAAAMAVDVALIRPLGLVATVAGAGIFVVSLPFSLLGQNTGEAAGALVASPFTFTFLRPLGDFKSGLPP